jgi:nucleoside-diphosphate-sugar epimerase
VGPGGTLSHAGVGFWPADTRCIGWSRGNIALPFVLVSDVVQALIKTITTPGIEGKSFNLAGDIRLTAIDYVSLLAVHSRRDFRFYPRSTWRLVSIEVAKWIVKLFARKRENPFPSYRDIKSWSLRAQIDSSAAKQTLGWQPVSDVTQFVREAILSHIPSICPGDLRLLDASPR